MTSVSIAVEGRRGYKRGRGRGEKESGGSEKDVENQELNRKHSNKTEKI